MPIMRANTSTRASVHHSGIRAGLLVGALALGGALLGCAGESSNAAPVQRAQGSAADNDLPPVLATVGSDRITMADIRTRIGDDLDQLDNRYRQARHQLVDRTLQEILEERVVKAEAEKQGKSLDDLVAAEAGGHLEPTDVEVAAWYDENKERLSGRPLAELRTQIADHLRQERRDEADRKLRERLNRERKVSVLLQPYRVPLDNGEAPSLGRENARVTLVEFSDFQCPFCGRFYPTLKRLEKELGDSLRIVYRQYPLSSIHPFAQKAAEASLCAKEQGKFWEMHDALFGDQEKLAVKDLKAKAGRLGLDQQKFDACLDTGRYVERVQDDQREGSRAGVTGTPALFVNGVPVEGGAVPYETVARAIQDEMARLSRNR